MSVDPTNYGNQQACTITNESIVLVAEKNVLVAFYLIYLSAIPLDCCVTKIFKETGNEFARRKCNRMSINQMCRALKKK
jgi:hypothetical protein